MSLIHRVSNERQSLAERLGPDLGVRGYSLILIDGRELRGVIESVGTDHLVLLQAQERERLIPLSSILFLEAKDE
ncbi:MAG: hypothetical protein RRB13_05905 [bacterium]|nr:hypothetical protein [bacterium]